MSKIAEKKALELYPDDPYDEYLDQIAGNKRDGYVDGYDQALQDFLEKARVWLFSDLYRYLINSKEISIDEILRHFKNYMQDE